MEKKILYHIGLYGFRKLIVYVIKDIYLLLALTKTVHSLTRLKL